MNSDEAPEHAEKIQESLVNFVSKVQPKILEKTTDKTTDYTPVIVGVEDSRGPNIWADYLKSNLRQKGATELRYRHLADTVQITLKANDGRYEEVYGPQDVSGRIAFIIDPREFSVTIYEPLKRLMDLGAVAAYYVPVSQSELYSAEEVKGKMPRDINA